MRAINLIPAVRLEQRRYAALRQRCIVACIVYGVAALGAAIAAHVLWNNPAPQLSQLLDEAAGKIERTDKSITSLKLDLDATQQTLKASRAISEQPDWSIILALLANRCGEEVVLKSCAVRQLDPPAAPVAPAKPAKAGAKAPAPPEPSMMLNLTGIGASQLAVSGFVLRLEETRLFAKVRLVETTRTNLERKDAVAFVIECSLDDPGLGKTSSNGQVAGRSAGASSGNEPTTAPAERTGTATQTLTAASPADEAAPGAADTDGGPKR